MAGLTFCQNHAFNWNGTPFKILKIQANNDILLENVTSQALSIEKQDRLLAEYRAGNISGPPTNNLQYNYVSTFSRPLDELSERDRLETQRRTIYLEALLQQPSLTFADDFLRPLISEVAKKINDLTPPCPRTLRRWHQRFMTNNDIRTLIPRYDLRGPKIWHQKEAVLKFASEAIEEAFAISPQANVPHIYTRFLGKIEMENSKNPLAEPIVAPSERT